MPYARASAGANNSEHTAPGLSTAAASYASNHARGVAGSRGCSGAEHRAPLAAGYAANSTLKPLYKTAQATPPPEPDPESETYPDWIYAASVHAKIVGGYHWGR